MMKRLNGKRMNPLHVWKLIRGGNLIFIILTQYLFRNIIIKERLIANGVFYSENATESANILFILIVLSTVFIAAAGYIINDTHDIKTDKINKPNRVIIGDLITIKSANQIYHSLNIIGLLLLLAAFIVLGKPSLITAPLLVSMMLYLYAVKYKCNGLLGNIFVAFSTSMVIILVWLFEYYRLVIGGAHYLLNDPGFQTLLIGYSAFAFVFTLLREWSKDMEDREGDLKSGCRHFIGKRSQKTANRIIAVGTIFSAILISIFQYYLLEFFPNHNLFNAIFVTITIVSLVNVVPLALKAKEKKDYTKLSSTYKLLMGAGILYMLLILFT